MKTYIITEKRVCYYEVEIQAENLEEALAKYDNDDYNRDEMELLDFEVPTVHNIEEIEE